MSTTNAVEVHPSNTEQLRAWDGEEGAYWAAHADHFDRAVAGYHEGLLSAAAITATDRVLDIGCGTGRTSRDAARLAAAGSALGVDLSSAMLDHALRQAAAEDLTNVSFLHADAQIHRFEPAAFDLAISRTGAMFFGHPVDAFTNIGRALRSGGRLALLVWQAIAANEWIKEVTAALTGGRGQPTPPPNAPGPFSLADPEQIRTVLSSAGYTHVDIGPVSAPMWFGTNPEDAHRFISGLLGWMLEGADEPDRQRALDDLRTTLTAHNTPDGVQFASAAWIVRARRR